MPLVLRLSLWRAVAKSESASVLPEYALVMASMTILGMATFSYVGVTAMNVESTNAQNFTAMNLQPGPAATP